MQTRTISYVDFLDKPHKDTYFFNFSAPELAELELSREGGVQKWIDQISNAKGRDQIMPFYEKFVIGSIGEVTPDGKNFRKNDQIRDDFKTSNAYEALFLEFFANAGAFADFINGLVPKAVSDFVASKEFTDEELRAMTDTEFTAVAGKKYKNMSPRHKAIAFERRNAGTAQEAAEKIMADLAASS